MSARDFLVFYTKENRVLAVAGLNRDLEMAAIEELMRLDRMPRADQLKDGSTNFLELKAAGSDENTRVKECVTDEVVPGAMPQIQVG